VLLNLLSKASKVNARGRPHRRRGLRAWQRDRPLPDSQRSLWSPLLLLPDPLQRVELGRSKCLL